MVSPPSPQCVLNQQRFLIGDEEYRNSRLKLILCLVDGPLPIRLLKPKPVELNVHGPRHPTLWTDVQKSVDSFSHKSSQVIIECDIDFISEKSYRKILNMIRPHMRSITIDIAFIISKPTNSEIEEPSACLGLWRIEKVDFERCAIFPDRTIDETALELSMILSKLDEEEL